MATQTHLVFSCLLRYIWFKFLSSFNDFERVKITVFNGLNLNQSRKKSTNMPIFFQAGGSQKLCFGGEEDNTFCHAPKVAGFIHNR